jgi:hypothetical protein
MNTTAIAAKVTCPNCTQERTTDNGTEEQQCDGCGFVWEPETPGQRIIDEVHRDVAKQVAVQHSIGYSEGWKYGLALGAITGFIMGAAAAYTFIQ